MIGQPAGPPPRHKLAHEVGCLDLAWPAGSGQVASVLENILRHRHAAYQGLAATICSAVSVTSGCPSFAGRLPEDLQLLVGRRDTARAS